MAHSVVKPEKLVATAVGILEQELVVPNTFMKKGIDEFKGADDDTINYKVPGVLPSHDYAWRNDRSSEIEFDEYAERKIQISFGGNTYSAVKITDEQKDFDLTGDDHLMEPQARAVAVGLERKALAHVNSTQFNVTIGNIAANLRGALVEARRVLNKFNVPAEQRVLLVGSDVEAALLLDKDMGLASSAGDSIAASKLQTATLGKHYGFNIVVSQDLAPDEAIAFVPSAFIFLSGAPSIPQSIAFGKTISYKGLALRWLRQYNHRKFQDESVLNTFYGFNTVKDPLRYWDAAANGGNGQEKITGSEYLVRAIKLTLDGSSDYPLDTSDLAKATGITEASVWTPTGRKPEADPANG